MNNDLPNALGILSDYSTQEELESIFDEMFECWVDGGDTIIEPSHVREVHYQIRLIMHIIKIARNDYSRKIECVPPDAGNADAYNSESD